MSKANEYQVGGSHYKSMRVEPWDVIDGCFTKEEAKGYYRGNVIKYVMRAGRKGNEVEDYRKAAHYLEKLIEVLNELSGLGEEKVMEKVAKVIEPAVRRYEWLRSILGDVGFVSDPFPEEECTVPSDETGVFDGTSTYLCIIADTRFEHYFSIHLMNPYVYREDDCVAYGWRDVDTSFFASNWKNPVTDVYNEYVVAWKRVK